MDRGVTIDDCEGDRREAEFGSSRKGGWKRARCGSGGNSAREADFEGAGVHSRIEDLTQQEVRHLGGVEMRRDRCVRGVRLEREKQVGREEGVGDGRRGSCIAVKSGGAPGPRPCPKWTAS